MPNLSRPCIAAFAAIFSVSTLACERQQPPATPPPPVVTVAEPLDREVTEWDEYTGRLEAKEKVVIRAQVDGYLVSVNFKEGGLVRKGDPLFVIDPRPYQATLDRTKGELDRAKAQRAFAETEFKRTQELISTNAATGFELEEKRAALEQAKAEVAVADANLQAAQLNVEFTEIRAPISGQISRTEVTVGNLVTKGEAVALTTITSLDPIYCYVHADEASVLRYQRLAAEKKRVSARDQPIPCKLSLMNERDFPHVGVIDFVNNEINPTTGTLLARGVFPNPNGTMTPQAFARLRVPGAAPYRTLLVAEEAIQSDQSKKFVLTVDAQDIVRRTYIDVGTSFGRLRSVVGGLKGDERIVVNGLMRARPESKVSPKDGPMPGADDAETLATTRVVLPPPGTPTTQPTTRPTTQPSAVEVSR